MANKLSAPLIDSKLPAQINTQLLIPYRLPNSVSFANIKEMLIQVKNVVSGDIIITISTTNYQNNVATRPGYYYCTCDGNFIQLIEGEYYRVQLAFKDNNENIGYYSAAGVTKIIAKPEFNLSIIPEADSQHRYCQGDISIFRATYTNMHSEPLTSYSWSLRRNGLEVSQTEVQNFYWDQLSNTISIDWQPDYNAYEVDDKLDIIFNYSTLNDYIGQSSLTNVGYWTGTSNSIGDNALSALFLHEEGAIRIILSKPTKIEKGEKYFIYRQVYGNTNWEQISVIYFPTTINTDFSGSIFTDYTVENGKVYRYCLIKLGQHFSQATEYVTVDLEHSYLSDGEKQLCIKFNPQVSSFKQIIQENKVETIGSKYPFFFRNGNVRYREIAMSGLLTYLLDENGDFGVEKKNVPLARTETPNTANFTTDFSTALTSDNIKREKDFKLNVEAWLTNGKPKLFRSATEGNYIVRLMNVSLSPNTQLGRMLHTFSATGYEVDSFGHKSLIKYELLRKGEIGNLLEPKGQTSIQKASDWEYFYEQLVVDENAIITQQRINDIVKTVPEAWYSGEEVLNRGVTIGQAPYTGNSWGAAWNANTTIPCDTFVAFLRQPMWVENIDLIKNFNLQIKYDESPIIFVNGAKVFESSGYVDHQYMSYQIGTENFKNGMNYICVQFENRTGGAGIDLSLTPIYK